VGCVGLPVAATIATAIIVIVAIVPSAERGSSDRARGCDGAADDVAGHDTRCGSPTIPLIAPLARQSGGVGVAEPFAAIGRPRDEQARWSAAAHSTGRPLRVPRKDLSPSRSLDRDGE
jgi:hypothetical protein